MSTLEMVNGAVALLNTVLAISCLLKLPVNIGGEDEVPARFLSTDFEEPGKALVRGRLAVEVQPVPVEAPG